MHSTYCINLRASSQRKEKWPQLSEESALRFFDRQVIDTCFSPFHQARGGELPELVSVATEPLTTVVMPLVMELHGHTVPAKAPELFLQSVVKLAIPLPLQKFDNSDPP